MKRKCALCGEIIAEVDFYVLSAGSPVCSSCIVSRCVRVCREHPGRETAGEMAVARADYGSMAAGRT